MNLNRAFALRLSNLLSEKKMSKYKLEKETGLTHSALRYIFNEVNSLTSTPPTSSTQATTGNNLNIHPSFWVFPWLCRSLYFVSINIKYFLIHTHKEGLCKYFWLAVCNKVPKVRRIKTTEINLLTVLEAGNLKSRCFRALLLLKGSRDESFWASSRFCWLPSVLSILSCGCITLYGHLPSGSRHVASLLIRMHVDWI